MNIKERIEKRFNKRALDFSKLLEIVERQLDDLIVEADTEEESLLIVEDGREEWSHKTDVFSIQIVETSKDGSVWIQDGKEGEQCSVTGDWVKTKQSKVIPYIDKFKYEEK